MTYADKVVLFHTHVNKAIELFGLHSYQFIVTEQEHVDARASNYYHSLQSSPDSDSRMFTICYTKDWLEEASKEDIHRTAFHEIFETMFYRLRDFSVNTDIVVSPREVDSQIHSIVRTFENRILPHLKNYGP